jgi:cyclopropane-fatty-acyl-phospholipid synthase
MGDVTIISAATPAAAFAGLPLSTRLAFAFAARLRRGTLEAILPDGRRFKFGGSEPGPAATMIIRDHAVARRFMGGGDIGLAEAYLRGEFETPDLTQFLYVFCINHEIIQDMLHGGVFLRALQRFRHWLNRNTRRQAKRNIRAHYDLGNRFYESWLDETMTYSSALFEPETSDLATAQLRKYESLAERLEIKPGHTLLEIGCGWGGFAEFVAKRFGARVVGLTISREQYDYAQQRMQRAGLNETVEIRLQDYRDEQGSYDRIASIEMIEAVGERFWSAYFRQLRDRLRPAGIAGIQAITIQDRFFQNYRRDADFIRRYIFPGGMLPSPGILKALGDSFGLPLIAEKVFPEDYARTLAVWRDRFRVAWPTLTPLGFDERFRRLWEFYLSYCEAGFLSRNIDVRQMIFAKAA